MKKLILTIALSFIGVATFAQNNTNTPQQSKNSTNRLVKPILLRITDDISNDDIGLELINNFYKIELSDITTSKKVKTIKKQRKQLKKAEHNSKEETATSNYTIILDLAVRTTNDMRPSIYYAEEITV